MVNAYYPKSIAEVITFLSEPGKKKIVCGGTDVMVRWKMETSVSNEKPVMVFINQIKELQSITETEDFLRIGSGCIYSDILKNNLVPEILRSAVRQIASPAIRNAGTIAGNICNASPAGDTLPVLYLLDAVIIKKGTDTEGNLYEKKVPVSDFIQGIRKIDLTEKELVTAIELPKKKLY